MSPLEHQMRSYLVHYGLRPILSALSQARSLAPVRIGRTMVVMRHISGHGIEIGAGAAPTVLPPGAKSLLVDKYTVDDLGKDPELTGLAIPKPDVVDDAESLSTFAKGSQDFALAFTVIEHLQNPLAMLEAVCRVVKPGGAIILSAPEKNRINDHMRPLTTFEHLIEDFEHGPNISLRSHLEEIAVLKKGLKGRAVEDYITQFLSTGGHTHFHVWDCSTFLDFLLRARAYLGLRYDIVEYRLSYNESIACLKLGQSSKSH